MTRQPQEPEPHHRQWLHALEDDRTVPGTAMQVARIFADYAASKGGRWATVPVKTLRHQTHRSNDALEDAIAYLVDQGWLTPQPNDNGQPRKNGQRKPYALTSGVPGSKREAFGQPERSASQNHSGDRNALSADRSGTRNGSGKTDRSGHRNATIPATGTQPFRPPERERHTSDNVSLPPRQSTLHALLAAQVPDVTERETRLILDQFARQPQVRSASAVMRTEIADGNGPALVARVRAQSPVGEGAAVASLQRGPECDHGVPGGASLHPTSGEPLCPICRTASVRRPA